MAKAELKPGQAKETTIRERVVDEAAGKSWWQEIPDFAEYNERPPFWEFIEWLADNWTNHTMNIWRFDPAAKNNIGDYVTKVIAGPLDPETLRQKIGGGKFKVYLKRGSALIYNETIGLEGAEKKPSEVAAATGAPSSDALNRLIDLIERRIANPNEDLTTKAMSNALDMQARGLESVFAKLVNQQPQNTLEQLLMQVRLMKELMPAAAPASGASALGTVKELAEVIGVVVGTMKSLGLGGSGGGDAWSALLGRAPELMDKLRETIREAKTPPGSVITAPATVIDAGDAQNPAPPPTAQLADAAAQLASGQAATEASPEFIEAKLVEMLTYQDPRTQEYQWNGEDAGAWVLITAPRMYRQIVTALQNPSMRQMMFAQRPILAAVAQHPRLKEFIEQFLAFATGGDSEKGSTPPGPVAVAPTPQA